MLMSTARCDVIRTEAIHPSVRSSATVI